jgi:hypothetical protein
MHDLATPRPIAALDEVAADYAAPPGVFRLDGQRFLESLPGCPSPAPGQPLHSGMVSMPAQVLGVLPLTLALLTSVTVPLFA